jgi:type II secretory pathway component GspD/PulD (secretin)
MVDDVWAGTRFKPSLTTERGEIMNRYLSIAAGTLLVLSPIAQPAVHGQQTDDEESAGSIYHAEYVPATDLAQAINTLLGSPSDAPAPKRPLVVAEPASNSLMLRGRPESIQRILEWLAQLDRKPPAVFVEAVVVSIESDEPTSRLSVRGGDRRTADEWIDELSKLGRLRVVARAQLMTLHDQPAYLQVGRREPHVMGVHQSSQGVTRSVERENVGLTLGLTPHVTPDGTVMLETDLERSDLDTPEEEIELSSSTGERAVAVTTLSLQTTVCACSGQTVVMGGLTKGCADGRWRKLVMLLTPEVIE